MTSATLTQGLLGAILSQANYTYDALDRRISKTVGTNTTNYFYEGTNIWRKVDITNQPTYYLADGLTDEWIARQNASGINWFLSDRLGSITGTTDNAGSLIATTQYDSFGRMTAQPNSAASDPITYTGREFDSETGLYYYRSREDRPPDI
jgi:YD repeat-containing protein